MSAYLGAKRWKPTVLQDLVFFQRGFDITKAEQQDGEIPVISSSGYPRLNISARDRW
jgi:type I restriction enzyme, S subunit